MKFKDFKNRTLNADGIYFANEWFPRLHHLSHRLRSFKRWSIDHRKGDRVKLWTNLRSKEQSKRFIEQI